MEQRFNQLLFKELGVTPNARILAAVSGGIDSVAMFHLLRTTGLEIAVAHVNFKLRGDESDDDEVFVKNLADRCGSAFHSRAFETAALAEKEGVSIQMKARTLRYNWFEELQKEYGYELVATAHHMEDQIETFFINLIRGTGISGLKGIPAKSGSLIRPMISFYRSEIEAYVKTHRLDYREDSSNSGTNYIRNRIRHQVLPLLEEIQPGFRKVMAGNLDHFARAEELLKDSLTDKISSIKLNDPDGVKISIDALVNSGYPILVMYEALREYGFSGLQVQQIWKALQNQPGKKFYSASHRLVKDRNLILIQPLSEIENQNIEIEVEVGTYELLTPVHLIFLHMKRDFGFQPTADPHKAFLDAGTVRWPVKLRKWKEGDKFRPLGMKGHMKLSDFFTANKFSVSDKERTWLLADADDQVIWIIGHRISEKNRIRPSSTGILAITLCE